MWQEANSEGGGSRPKNRPNFLDFGKIFQKHLKIRFSWFLGVQTPEQTPMQMYAYDLFMIYDSRFIKSVLTSDVVVQTQSLSSIIVAGRSIWTSGYGMAEEPNSFVQLTRFGRFDTSDFQFFRLLDTNVVCGGVWKFENIKGVYCHYRLVFLLIPKTPYFYLLDQGSSRFLLSIE